MSTPPSRFIFAVCQVGAEHALKSEIARECPDFRFAFSRPGFVTFKSIHESELPEDFRLRSVFARSSGLSLGRVDGDDVGMNAAAIWDLIGAKRFDHLHIWQRDRAVPGDYEFEPGESEAAREAGNAIVAAQPDGDQTTGPLPVNQVAVSGQRVLDCAIVDPGQYWIGAHVATDAPSCWPGGSPQLTLPAHAVSRAYLKMRESLMWSQLPMSSGDRCVEIGSSPGGSCQCLLDRGLVVTGIDPADMASPLMEDPRFTHVRARGSDLKRREYRRFKWLMVDSNVAPKHTLDTVEHIVTNRQVNIRGMLLTLKLPDWKLAASVPEYLDRVRSWGYGDVRARQLAHNRQEICVAAS